MTKNKLAIYIPSLSGGGAERAILTLANALTRRGVNLDLVLGSATGPYLSEVAEQVRIIDLGCRRVTASLPGLAQYIKEVRPDVMLSAMNHANVIAIVARMVSRVPLRLVVSERVNVSRKGAFGTAFRSRFILPLMRWTYPKADDIIAVSDGVANDLSAAIGLRRDRIRVIYNPVVSAELLRRAKEPLVHPWVGASLPPIVLGVGRLTRQKDFATLIKAFAEVLPQRECRLVILGEGELRGELEALAAGLGVRDSVLLPGFSTNPFAWMSRSAVFVLSSAWEGLPNVLIQAMACGARVVSTDCPSGPNEILEGGRWGRLVHVGDIDGMAAAIMEATNPDSKYSFPIGGYSRFEVDQVVEAYARVLFGKAAPV